jgi:heme/copper-type cytochrome/quinol oxidase subunit 3
LFLSFQALTWRQLIALDFRIEKGLYDSITFSLIAFHAAHVLGGIGSLLWILKNSYRPAAKIKGGYTSENCIGPQLVGWFWHFLCIVWVIFYTLLVLV